MPELKQKNDTYLERDKNSTSYIWIHRDAPEIVKEGLRILCYTGILTEHSGGIRATRSEVGRRYTVNLGCLFAQEATPSTTSFTIAKSLTPKRMSEYGVNHSACAPLSGLTIDWTNIQEGFDLNEQLGKPNTVLDITAWQRSKIAELNLSTVGSVLAATEAELKEAHYVGDVRARRMRNAAIASVLEYLSG